MAVRLMGVNLKDQDRLEFALTNINGIGFNLAKKILHLNKIDEHKRVKDLEEDELRRIQKYIEDNIKVEGDLKSLVAENIKRLREIGTYRGFRHIHGLPSRGQRTRSNARTRKGRKKTIGALTKEAWAKIDQQQNKAKK